ncbi:unnamed protein product [Pelagomonas calceolata]|uniref:DUF4349 domain-containing protein n=1 Tax=Pelagomonas calceolata TaxID=35677 RepID=A0A7S4EDT4_9STRA|nr:unnamed protein product [Pelagomonas calceolata]|mmetsp:Transcript_13851/g.39779  ORF Transcript_13851/g.39779 Transcript_13851/m.39779 type:complete len:385 (+) Transcript_13851:185-1339(+)
MRERIKKPCEEIAINMGASLKPSKGPLSPKQKLVGRVALGLIACYLVTAATAASSPRGNRLVYQEGDMRSFARSSRGAPAMAAAPEMMMMAEDAAMDEPQMMRTSMKSARYSRGAPGSSLGGEILDVETKPFDASSVKTMLVRTGTLRIETDADVDKVANAATSQVEAAGGFVESRQDNGGYLDGDIRRGQNVRLTLRIPVEKYASLLQDFRKSIGGLTSAKDVEETTDRVRDVTGEYVDNAARASTLEATRAQLQALMSRADLVKDVLQVQRELSSVVQQLEARKATMQRLSAQASLSTLQLTLSKRDSSRPPPPFERVWSPSKTVRRAFKKLIRRTQRLADGVIYLFVFAAPLALVALLVVVFCGVPLRARLADLADFSAGK